MGRSCGEFYGGVADGSEGWIPALGGGGEGFWRTPREEAVKILGDSGIPGHLVLGRTPSPTPFLPPTPRSQQWWEGTDPGH